MTPRNSLIALLAAVLLVFVAVTSIGRRTPSEAGDGPRSAPVASSIAPPPGTSLETGVTTDGSGLAPGGSPEVAAVSGQDLLPPDDGDPTATDLYPTSMSPDLPDPSAAGPSADPYPTSVGPEDLASGDASPTADPFPTSLPDDQPDWRDVAESPGDSSASPTSTDSAAGLPDVRAPTDLAQRPQDAHPTEEQSSPTG